MLKVAMAARGSNMPPTTRFNQPNHIANLHYFTFYAALLFKSP
jgi:hypothetical protein